MMMRTISCLSVLALLCLLSVYPAKSSAEVESSPRKFIGTWRGMMKSPVSSRQFPVEIELREFKTGKWCGDLRHAQPLDADGKLLGIHIDGQTMVLAQTVFRGRSRCLDGLNVLKLVDDQTIVRVWIDPSTGIARDTGILSRVR